MLDKVEMIGVHGFAEFVQRGFTKDKDYPAVFATGCTVTFLLRDGEWDINVHLPNGHHIGVYATPENVEVRT